MPKVISEKTVFSTKHLHVNETKVKLSSNEIATYHYLHLGESAMMVPINENGEVLLIREYFQTLDQVQLSLPKGRIEEGHSALQTANKELQEEIGYKAEKLDKLGVFTVAPGYVKLKTHVFLAQDLKKSKLEGDWDEEIELVSTPLSEIDNLIENGEITEARVIAALFLARRHLYR
ncbi:MAG TPA: NUDIX domain-containing protein [Patescibacteria group bacterium]|nr:NUDIX domain-containing protein [Patescibacteria group bacterium]